MKRQWIATVSVLFVIALAVGGCNSSAKKSATTTTSGAETASTGGPTTTSARPSQASITASDALTFSPDTLTATVGQTVTWMNGGGIAHTVTFDAGPAFNQPLGAGATVTRVFTTAGTFAYHCNIHGQSMHGTIVVK